MEIIVIRRINTLRVNRRGTKWLHLKVGLEHPVRLRSVGPVTGSSSRYVSTVGCERESIGLSNSRVTFCLEGYSDRQYF